MDGYVKTITPNPKLTAEIQERGEILLPWKISENQVNLTSGGGSRRKHDTFLKSQQLILVFYGHIIGTFVSED